MIAFGLASITVHAKIAVSPSLTLYGLDEPDHTSGSSKIYTKNVVQVDWLSSLTYIGESSCKKAASLQSQNEFYL